MPERHRLKNAALSRGYERERRNLERGEEALKRVEVRCPMIAMIRLFCCAQFCCIRSASLAS
jgi:hypothetical protein